MCRELNPRKGDNMDSLRDTNVTLKKRRGRPPKAKKIDGPPMASLVEPDSEFQSIKARRPFGILKYREKQILKALKG